MQNAAVPLIGRRGVGDGAVRVSVVLPCLNEAESVGRCVREAIATLAAAGLPGEVVVVDNGSSDTSAEIAAEAGARVVKESRPGYGSALRAGIAAATGDIVVMADADVSYDLARIPDLVRPIIEREADLVLGTRDANGRSMPFLHRFIGTPLLTFLVSRASGDRASSDSQSGFRAFRRDAIASLRLRSTGMEFASEMLIKAARAGWRIADVRTTYRPRVGQSKLSTFRDGWRHLRLIVLLAPDLVLIWPGAAAALLGIVLAIWTLLDPAGIHVGSTSWQPVFFSTIALVVGVQAVLAGSVIAYQSSITAPHRRSAFVGSARFLRCCTVGGLLAAAAGLVIDAALFVLWVRGGPAPSRGPQLASLAQGLIIVGVTALAFGFVTRLVINGRAHEEAMDDLPLEGAA